MHVLAAMQLQGEADEMQIDGAELAGTFNMGGAGVANYVSILRSLKKKVMHHEARRDASPPIGALRDAGK